MLGATKRARRERIAPERAAPENTGWKQAEFLLQRTLARVAGGADGVMAIVKNNVKNNKKPGAVTRPGAISQFQFPE